MQYFLIALRYLIFQLEKTVTLRKKYGTNKNEQLILYNLYSV